MRYDDWDVLLFPSGGEARVPLKEFKVGCSVVPDGEFSHNPGTFGLPVMTCFVPGLQPGAPFHISIHCWGNPKVSQYTQSYSKHPELVKLEARVLVDGRLVASTTFPPFGLWPHLMPRLITSTSEVTKQGELEQLKFPSFRRELLYQNHWNPGDDLGRIKIVISEGFPRDSPSNPFERVKNVVAFAFQHAPLDILETNDIAWPNPQMWRRHQCNSAMPVPTYYPDEGADSHSHSPRRRSYTTQSMAPLNVPMPTISSALTAPSAVTPNMNSFNPNIQTFQKSSAPSGSSLMESFSETAYQEWINTLGLNQQQQSLDVEAVWPCTTTRNYSKYTSTDQSVPTMSDYLSSTMGHTMDPNSMHLSGPGLDDDIHLTNLKVPTNTPTTMSDGDTLASGQFAYNFPNSAISSELASSLTHSLLNQAHPLSVASQSFQPNQIQLPAAEIKSRKENRHLNNASSIHSPSSNPSPSIEAQIRKFSQTSNAFGVIGNDHLDSSGSCPGVVRRASAGEFGRDMTNTMSPNQTYAGVAASAATTGSSSDNGTKRSRNFTPASSKAIDLEDEPRRASPRRHSGTVFPEEDRDRS
ncbi:hypothetical protein VP1G_08136 [Cytospora mali]|uniref:Uncharacterized protein n=1 Tax=Cytospora mali TaxID=578113 RepID=A0A194VAQ4_CYTMA|nr:hypothetical protein VP1G_08136 [Valsa mali var. pyri (nom. inval.)]